MQSFYNDRQKKGDSIVVYASRLEDTLSKAITLGHIETVARWQEMVCSEVNFGLVYLVNN